MAARVSHKPQSVFPVRQLGDLLQLLKSLGNDP